ncbi:MAG: sporulation protein YqfC [Ruminococcaceae bacterium]|nr:sporulation protein YqfC [Oscillospiraceae bacterium]
MKKKKHQINVRETAYKKSRAERMAEIFDLPKDIVLNLPKMTFTGNRELYVENYRGIVEYSESVMRFNAGDYLVTIMGRGLGIKNIATEEITLCGNIKSLEFC